MKHSRRWILIACVIAVFGAVAAVSFVLRPRQVSSRPQMDNKKREFVQQSLKNSQELTRQGIEHLRNRQVGEAANSFVEAIKIFPLNSEAYSFLLKIYLMTGQEQKIYETLEQAGRSYPAFDKIIGVIDDENLARIPMPDEKADVYIAPFPQNKKMALTFMFDDGETSVYTGIMPMLDRFDYKATVSVIAAQVANRDDDPLRGSWRQWKDAAARGFEIANHSMRHRDARTLKPEEYKDEIDDAKALIEKNIGKKVLAYVFPFDRFTDPVLQHVLQGHFAARDPAWLRFTYDKTVDIMYGGNNFSIGAANRLVDIGIARRLWLIAECHGLDRHMKASYKPLTEEFFQAHLLYIKEREKDIWVGTFSQVFQYLLVRKQSRVERKNIGDAQAEIIWHQTVAGSKAIPVTVVLTAELQQDARIAATLPDGRPLKAWGCGEGHICVDVTEADRPVRVTWGHGGVL